MPAVSIGHQIDHHQLDGAITRRSRLRPGNMDLGRPVSSLAWATIPATSGDMPAINHTTIARRHRAGTRQAPRAMSCRRSDGHYCGNGSRSARPVAARRFHLQPRGRDIAAPPLPLPVFPVIPAPGNIKLLEVPRPGYAPGQAPSPAAPRVIRLRQRSTNRHPFATRSR